MSGKYVKYRDCKYAVAWDIETKTSMDDGSELIEYNKKDYRGFNTFKEFQRFVEDPRNNNVYQVINQLEIKPYWDIDYKDIVGGSFTEEALEKQLSIMIKEFKTAFNGNIEREDFIIETRKDYPYTSIHLIVDCVSVNVKDLIKFNYYLKDKYGDEFSYDKKVYTNYRLFRMCNMWKLSSGPESVLINHKSSIHKPLESRIISDTSKTKKIKLKKEIREMAKGLIKSIEYSVPDIVKTGKEVIVNSINMDLVYDLLNDLHKSFFLSGEWTFITRLIIRDLECENMDFKRNLLRDWGIKSAEKVDNKWTMKQNENYIRNCRKSIETLKNCGLNSFIKVVNKYLDYQLITEKKIINERMIKYISNHSGLNASEIIETIETTEEDAEWFMFNDDCVWNRRNQYLINDNVFYNYNEIEYSDRIQSINYEIDYDDTITDINEMKKFNEMLLDKEIHNLIVKAKWGTGKSHYSMTPIIEKLCKNKHNKILIITENNSLNAELYNKFKKYGFITHQSHNEKVGKYNRYICSVESSIDINIYDYDLVVLDEYETILSQYESEETINKKSSGDKSVNYKNYINFKKIITDTGRLLIMDADISKNRIEWIKEIRSGEYHSVFIDINNFNDCVFNQYINKETFNSRLYNDFQSGLRLIISSNSKRKINEYYRSLLDFNKIRNDRVILKIDGDGAEIDIREKTINGDWVSVKHECDSADSLRNEVKKNGLEDFLEKNNVDILLYTPTIKTGLSVNQEYFHKHYSFGMCGSVNSRTYLQMLFRARLLKKREFNIFITGGFKLRKYVDSDRMGEVFINIASVHKTLNYKMGIFNCNEDDKENMSMDNHYFALRMNNKVENFNSNLNFNSDVITKLKLVHKLNHKYIVDIDNNEEIERSLAESGKLLQSERLKLLVETPLISKREYLDIQKRVEENKINKNKHIITATDWDKRYKYNLLLGRYDNITDKDFYKFKFYFKNLERYSDLEMELLSLDTEWNNRHKTKTEFGEVEKVLYGEYHKSWIKLLDFIKTKINIYTEPDVHINHIEDLYDAEKLNYETTEKYVSVKDFLETGEENEIHKREDRYNRVDCGELNSCVELLWDTETKQICLLMNMGHIIRERLIYENIETDNNYIIKREEIIRELNEARSSYEIINNEEFYKVWDCKENKRKYSSAISAINLMNENVAEVGPDTETELILVDKKHKKHIDIGFIKSLLGVIGVNDIRDDYHYTNKELLIKIAGNMDKLIEMDNDYSEKLTELNEKCIEYNDYRNDTDKKKVYKKYKNIIKYLNEWLGKINIVIRYTDKHTDRDSGKLRIGFNPLHPFNSDLEKENIIKQLTEAEIAPINEVHKIRKGYKDENKKPIHKYNTKHFSTTDNISVSMDVVCGEVKLELDLNYESDGENEIFRRYKTKHSKKLTKKKVDKMVEKFKNDIDDIKFYDYVDLVSIGEERDKNTEKIKSLVNPLKEEIMEHINKMNSPVLVGNVGEECYV